MTLPQAIMKSVISLACLLTIAFGGSKAWSQGATGGSLGNDNKSLSGSAPEPRAAPARRERPERREPAPRRSSGGESGGSTARFDGIWVVTAFGQSSVCAGQTSSNTVTVSGGRISGNNVQSGSVSASGAVHATGRGSGLTNTTDGRLSGRGGGGTFRQSDGCTGRWTASKQ